MCSVVQKYIEGSFHLPNTKVKRQLLLILDIIYLNDIIDMLPVWLT